MGEIVGVTKKLVDQRLVETELLPDLLDRFLGGGGAGEIRRRIARQRTRQQEGDDDDPDQARDRKHQPLANHGQHGGGSAAARNERGNGKGEIRSLHKYSTTPSWLSPPPLS